jgi:uncharacterized membrane protein YcaP (DUF421 family)
MEWFQWPDWGRMLAPSTPLLEIVVRGTLMYLGLFVILRTVLKRMSGTVGITDLLVVVLLADAAQNGLADDYVSILDGLALVATIVFWNYALDWLGFRFPALQRFIHPPALLLVRDGTMMRRNMRRELITEDELRSELREQGIEDLSRVKSMWMEGDGAFSVVCYDEERHDAPQRPAM